MGTYGKYRTSAGHQNRKLIFNPKYFIMKILLNETGTNFMSDLCKIDRLAETASMLCDEVETIMFDSAGETVTDSGLTIEVNSKILAIKDLMDYIYDTTHSDRFINYIDKLYEVSDAPAGS